MAFKQYAMDWRQKARAYRVFDTLPFGTYLYHFTQKRITKTVPRRLNGGLENEEWFLKHIEAFREFGVLDIAGATHFEFGAGWDLCSNLIFWCYGVPRQIVYDQTRWARADQVNFVIDYLRKNPPPGACRIPNELVGVDLGPSLRRLYGIQYVAPGNASDTNLPSQSIDTIATFGVLEHVPQPEIVKLIKECHRLMHDRSIMSHIVNYSDHYSHSDPGITPYNFLQFSEREWRAYNPQINFQNRLRHKDYLEMFKSGGFRMLFERSYQPDNAAELLSKVELDQSFLSRPMSEILPLEGHFVMTKSG
jgi:hypothetical protein